ncbi:uncharacterized protein LOC127835091 isoform X3 [Dreissena polymorpha]|uniref:uncharacterized protein LOC127835091 isoform X2 n=1 Tax=Dreissena polymorpha TaxID=45954 RepID=UPI0022642289|nr:uncharacterized protein LOC127835091 isoform X2 [Dreissena polymorpha]XP_052217326.1 uncharacterized protein LOC127835091 isoform X3 [Dreissena polymorpha]
MQAICIFLGVIVACYAATTHRPPHTTHAHNTGPTHEPAETDSITFQFQPLTFHLLVKTHPDKMTYNCYIAALSDSEHAQIHTDAGMRAVELRILASLGSATAVTDVSTLDKRDVTTCTSHFSMQPHYFTITV